MVPTCSAHSRTPALLAVETRGIRRHFGGVVALEDVTLAIGQGEFFSLLGPSGCGKTTFLRLVAGLDVPQGGELRLLGEPAEHVPAHRRPVNTVFQSYALFPHLSVRDNVAFGLRMKRVGREESQRRVSAVMDLVRIGGLGDRRPDQLSGGQQQRVALARALVNEPKVLLLDEPLAALDRQLRGVLQGELRELQRRTGVTFVLVTHDQEEALAMSDRLAVMRGGRVEQVGTGEELYRRPRSRFVAEFLGACNVLSASVRDRGGALAELETPIGILRIPPAQLPVGWIQRTPLSVGIRPEDVRLARGTASLAGEGKDLAWLGSGTLREVRLLGAATELLVEVRGQLIRARRLGPGEGGGWEPGGEVVVGVAAGAVAPLED